MFKSFLSNEFSSFFIFSGFSSLSKRSKFRRLCSSRDRTCPFSTLDAIERRVLCIKLRLVLSSSFDSLGSELLLSTVIGLLICRGLESNTLSLPTPSASEIVDDLDFKVSLLAKTLVDVARNNVSTWRL